MTKAEIDDLKESDARFKHFVDLKNVSAHDLMVRADKAEHWVQPDFVQPDAVQGPLFCLNDWPEEDLVSYCGELVTTLDSLVRKCTRCSRSLSRRSPAL